MQLTFFFGLFCDYIYNVINNEPASILDLRSDLPEVLAKVTKKTLAKDVDERYPNCLDVAYDLRVALRGLSGPNKDEKITCFVDFIRLLPFFRDFTKEQVVKLKKTLPRLETYGLPTPAMYVK